MDAELPTRVAHAGHGDNRYFGHTVGAELAGRTSWWSIVALACGHAIIAAEDAAVLDDLVACSTVADPRIWPLKLVRVASAWGHPLAALGTAMRAIEGFHGPMPALAAARWFTALRSELGDVPDPAALAESIARRLRDDPHPLGGFGVAARAEDERVVWLQRCLERRGRCDGVHWRLMRAVEAELVRQRGTPVNISGAAAAILLDLGFAAEAVPWMSLLVLFPNLYANAIEGGAQAPAILRELPPQVVDYRGPPPRRSPRAQGREG